MKIEGEPVAPDTYTFTQHLDVECPICHAENWCFNTGMTLRGVREVDVVIKQFENGFEVRWESAGVIYTVIKQVCGQWRPPDPNAEDFSAWEQELGWEG